MRASPRNQTRLEGSFRRALTQISVATGFLSIAFAWPGIAAAERPCRIVVFDTADTTEAYSPRAWERGETNAHYIVDHLYKTNFGYPKIAIPAIVGVKFQTGREAFLDPAPDLAIVHRSAFDHRDVENGDAQLVLLVAASKSPTKILVYSRKIDTGDTYATAIAEAARAAGRVSALRFPRGNPFKAPDGINTLLTRAKALLPPKGCS